MHEPTDQQVSSVHVVAAARVQEPILTNLLEPYIHDFSEFHFVELGQDGRFGYKGLSDYWTEPDHHPFLITADNKLAGFALVKKARALTGDHQVWDMAEFFVVRAHRKQGVGLAAAHQVWKLFPGPWQVRVMNVNRGALEFWQRAIDTFAGQHIDPAPIERDGKTWAVFSFDNKAVVNG